jgi:hypothetical protein
MPPACYDFDLAHYNAPENLRPLMQPLAGITVVSLEQAIAAPFATRQLADLGARVIKIERPDGGDFARGYDATVNGMSSHFVWTNRSKESLTLDLKRPESQFVLDRLLAKTDVFVQNLIPGATARLRDSDSQPLRCARNIRASLFAIYPVMGPPVPTAIKWLTICSSRMKPASSRLLARWRSLARSGFPSRILLRGCTPTPAS